MSGDETSNYAYLIGFVTLNIRLNYGHSNFDECFCVSKYIQCHLDLIGIIRLGEGKGGDNCSMTVACACAVQ
jgi:hypothetical protein